MLVPVILLGGFLLGAYKLSSLAPASAPCELGTCPLTIHESDSGRTFSYNVGTRFSVFLDETRQPKSELQCAPQGVIVFRGYAPAEPPAYAATFEVTELGTCVLTDKDFSATIVVQ